MNERSPGHSASRSYLVFALLSLLVMLIIISIIDAGSLSYISIQNVSAIQHLPTPRIDLSSLSMLALVALGFVAGVCGGMTGMGSGIILISCLLLFFDIDIFLARAVAVVTTFAATVVAAIQHFTQEKEPVGVTRMRHPDAADQSARSVTTLRIINSSGKLPSKQEEKRDQSIELFMLLIVPALFGVLLGVWLGSMLPRETLKHIFGIFLLFLSFYMLALLCGDPQESRLNRQLSVKIQKQITMIKYAIGCVHGFLCGLFGISGGVVTTPLQHILIGSPIHRAIVTSIYLSALCSLVAAIAVSYQGVDQQLFTSGNLLRIAACLVVGSTIGANVGARVSSRVSTIVLRVVFVFLGLGAGLSILF